MYTPTALPLSHLRNHFPAAAALAHHAPMAVDSQDETNRALDREVSLGGGGIAVPCDNNGGSDVLVAHPLAAPRDDGVTAVVAVEQAKYTRVDAKTPLKLKDVTDACARIAADFAAHRDEDAVRPLAVGAVVFLALRKLEGKLREAGESGTLPAGCIVLDRNASMAWLGPTLSQRPQFIVSMVEALPDAVIEWERKDPWGEEERKVRMRRRTPPSLFVLSVRGFHYVVRV